MRKRADEVSGELKIESMLGGGTTVTARAPVRALSRHLWSITFWRSFWEHRFHEQ
jgi:hypothetical protein